MNHRTQPRIQPGVSTGGQFATIAAAEPDVQLTPFAGGTPPGQIETDEWLARLWQSTDQWQADEEQALDDLWAASRAGATEQQLDPIRTRQRQAKQRLSTTPLGLALSQGHADHWARTASPGSSPALLATRARTEVDQAEQATGGHLMVARDGHLVDDEAWESIVPVATPADPPSRQWLRVMFIDENSSEEVGRLTLATEQVTGTDGRLTKAGVVEAVNADTSVPGATLRAKLVGDDEDWW